MRPRDAASGAWASGFLLWLVGLAGERGSIGIGWELAMLCGAGVLVSATLYRRWTDLGREPLPSRVAALVVAYGGGGLTIVTIVVAGSTPILLALPLVFFGLLMVLHTFPPAAATLTR